MHWAVLLWLHKFCSLCNRVWSLFVFGFGMKQAQRSALALGICSRNGGAMFVAFTTFPVQDPNVLVMILLAVPVPVIVWLILARYFASRADKLVAA